LKIFFL